MCLWYFVSLSYGKHKFGIRVSETIKINNFKHKTDHHEMD